VRAEIGIERRTKSRVCDGCGKYILAYRLFWVFAVGRKEFILCDDCIKEIFQRIRGGKR